MKNNYETPVMELIKIYGEDIIKTSGLTEVPSSEGDQGNWSELF